MRFGALIGLVAGNYTSTNYFATSSSAFEWGGTGGIDVSLVFPVGKQLHTVLNAGGRYSEVTSVQTYSFPVTVGLNFKLENNH